MDRPGDRLLSLYFTFFLEVRLHEVESSFCILARKHCRWIDMHICNMSYSEHVQSGNFLNLNKCSNLQVISIDFSVLIFLVPSSSTSSIFFFAMKANLASHKNNLLLPTEISNFGVNTGTTYTTANTYHLPPSRRVLYIILTPRTGSFGIHNTSFLCMESPINIVRPKALRPVTIPRTAVRLLQSPPVTETHGCQGYYRILSSSMKS